MAFDTLTYSKRLQEAGFTARQAEAQAEALRDVVEQNLATKQDIESVRQETEVVRRDIKELEVRIMQQFELVRRDMEVTKRDIVICLGGLIIAAATALGIVNKLL